MKEVLIFHVKFIMFINIYACLGMFIHIYVYSYIKIFYRESITFTKEKRY